MYATKRDKSEKLFGFSMGRTLYQVQRSWFVLIN